MRSKVKDQAVMFVSHCGSDDFLAALQRYCHHVEVIVSDWHNESGESLATKIKADIARSDLVLAILSPGAGTSAWVNQEIGLAIGLGKYVIPVLSGGGYPDLPGLLSGFEYIPLNEGQIEETALRVATRVSQWLERELVRQFDTFQKYCNWWTTIRESDYTNGVCLWAAPHDVWSWFSEPGSHRNVHYRTLIRGSLLFDHETVGIHFGGDEIVVGVQELDALQELHVFGNLTVQTFYEPDYRETVEIELARNPGRLELHEWYRRHAETKTQIEVQLSMDPVRADGHRRRLNRLFEKYSQNKAGGARPSP